MGGALVSPRDHWPTVYVVDRRGVVRYGWEGELSFNG